MKRTIRYRTAAIALAGLSSVGALGLLGTSAQAQTGTTTATTTPATSTSKADTRAAREAAHQAQRDADLADMAARLGVTKEKLVQALKDQAKADVDKALAAGKITADEATARKAAIDAGTGGKGGPGHGGRGKGDGDNDSATKPTPPTAAERKAERDARDTELAARLGVTKEKLVQARKDQAKARVDAAVAAGELTPEQAATVKQAIDQDIPGFGGPGGGPGGGGHGGGPGGGHGGGGGGHGGR